MNCGIRWPRTKCLANHETVRDKHRHCPQSARDDRATVAHLVRLVDDLLDVSRIVHNRIELRKEPIDLASIFTHGIETAQPVINAQGHQLQVAWPQEPIHVQGDPVRLAQVVSNLLVNAAKYTDKAGRIFLTGAREDAAVSSGCAIRASASILPSFPTFSICSPNRIAHWRDRKAVSESD